jgi:hypothetical protein
MEEREFLLPRILSLSVLGGAVAHLRLEEEARPSSEAPKAPKDSHLL